MKFRGSLALGLLAAGLMVTGVAMTPAQAAQPTTVPTATQLYSNWYAAAGGGQVPLAGTIRANDHLSAQITVLDSGNYQYSLTNMTRHWTDTTTVQDGNTNLLSADVGIIAVPTGSGAYYPLSNFGTVDFTNARLGWPMGSWEPDPVNMTASNGSTTAMPTSFATTGSGAYLDFTVLWRHA